MPNESKIDNEINDMADKMQKSTMSPRQQLFNTIMELGPEGLKKALPTLSLKEQEMLKSCLNEMKKSSGEGSKGGKVIGHTKSGKPIYDTHSHDTHNTFSPQDHRDAVALHTQISTPIRNKIEGPIDQNDKRSQKEKNVEQQQMHREARRHEVNARGHMIAAYDKENIKKASNMPKFTDDAKKVTPEKTETPAKKMKTESLSGSDNQDEKLMEDQNKDIKHQGGPKDSPLEGQVIKGREPGQEHKGPGGGIIIGHTSTGKPMYANAEHPAHKDMDHKDHKEAARMHQGHADRIRSQMDMAERDEKGEPKDKDNHVEMYDQARMHEKNAMEHQEQAGKKEDKEMKKCYGPSMMKSLRKEIKQERKLAKSLFNASLKAVDCKEESEPTKEQCVNEISWKINQLKELRDSSWLMEQEIPEVKEIMEKKFSKLKSEIRALCEKHSGLKKAYENFMTKAEGKNMKKADAEKREDAAIDESKQMQEEAAQAKDKKENPSPEKLAKKEMKKAKKVAKSLKKIVKLAKALKMSKEEVVKAIKGANNNLKLVKAEMKAKLLKEEDQVKMGGQDKKEPGDKEEKINKEEADLKIKADQTADEAVNKVPKMEKSVNWNMKSSIAANSLGRNTHYEVDAYIQSSDAERKEIIKKGEYFGEQKGEVLQKSATEKADLNDLIEKGFDYSTEEIKRIQDVGNHKADGIVLKKSFHDKDIAAALGMDEATYKKLMGSDE